VQTSAGEWTKSFVQAFEWNPMIEHPVLKKYVQSFHIIQMKSFFWCVVMRMGKSNNPKKKNTMSYVVMFGYEKGLAHCMYSHVWLW
jgi:hypothetical protein